jgi:hypothetical protein
MRTVLSCGIVLCIFIAPTSAQENLTCSNGKEHISDKLEVYATLVRVLDPTYKTNPTIIQDPNNCWIHCDTTVLSGVL